MPKAPKEPKRDVHLGRPSELMSHAQMTQANEMHLEVKRYAQSLPPGISEQDRKRLLTAKLTVLASELLDTPLFMVDIKEGDPKRNRAKWMEALRRKVRNQKSRQPKTDTASAGASSSSGPVLPPGPLDAVEDEKMHTIRRCFLLMRGEFSARELFIFEEGEAIKAEMQRLADNGSLLVGGALRNHAIKLLWTDEKKEEYADKVDPDLGDIEANQDLFPTLLAKALADILKRGVLGTALVKVLVAVQDPTGDLTSSIFYEGFDSANSKPITHLSRKAEGDPQ
ncbi:hypothetical protein BKA70DRAFT_1419242 [Coprinopsis sp. MPI-PUGE-AT-0042]|nr:hypothetical protein BKA70DRAFT_1419242 [Coprinopsis sp. MPI-PUGE-AT-0042]